MPHIESAPPSRCQTQEANYRSSVLSSIMPHSTNLICSLPVVERGDDASVLQCVAVCCSVLQYAAVCCSVLQCVALCCSVSQCVAVCRSVLQCVAVCCSVLQCVAELKRSRKHCTEEHNANSGGRGGANATPSSAHAPHSTLHPEPYRCICVYVCVFMCVCV